MPKVVLLVFSEWQIAQVPHSNKILADFLTRIPSTPLIETGPPKIPDHRTMFYLKPQFC